MDVGREPKGVRSRFRAGGSMVVYMVLVLLMCVCVYIVVVSE